MMVCPGHRHAAGPPMLASPVGHVDRADHQMPAGRRRRAGAPARWRKPGPRLGAFSGGMPMALAILMIFLGAVVHGQGHVDEHHVDGVLGGLFHRSPG